MDKFPSPLDSKKRTLMEGGIRSLIAAAPMVGGFIAQGWSEYSNAVQNHRISEFFNEMASGLVTLEAKHSELKEKIASMPDQAELLERAVEAAAREASDKRRPLYSKAYLSFLESPSNTSPDERRDLLQEIEQLTEKDLEVLLKYKRSGRSIFIGANFTDSGMFSVVAGQIEPENWIELFGPLIHSFSKLVGRGLLIETQMNGSFSWSGDSSSHYNQFRRRAWQITPMGRKLADTISD